MAARADADTMTCVSARGVTKRFGERVALNAVDIDVQPGRVVGLLGPNGAGKTTLLHAMLGWLPVEGELRVLGMDPWHNRTALMRSGELRCGCVHDAKVAAGIAGAFLRRGRASEF